MPDPIFDPEQDEFWMPENWPGGRAPARYDVERNGRGWKGVVRLRVPELLGSVWERIVGGPTDRIVSLVIGASSDLEAARDRRMHLDPGDVALLEQSQRTHETLEVVVNACAYSCCGRGWQRRDGYEQTYHGYVDNLQLPAGGAVGTFMLYSVGIGGISYVIAVRFHEVDLIQA